MMKSDKFKFLMCGLFFVVLAAISFRCVWPANQVFSASDLNIGRLAAIKNNLPAYFLGSYNGNQLLGGSGCGVSFFYVLLSLFPVVLFANAFYGAVIGMSSVALVWFLRMWKRSWMASIFGALVAFWFNQVMLAVGGHAYKMEVMAFSVLALGLIEKAVRAERTGRSIGYAVLAGLSVGIMMNEQQDVALLAGLFVGPYALLRLIQAHCASLLRWVAVLVPIGVVALLLAGGTMLKSYDQNIAKATTVQNENGDKWNFITQWSMVPSEWPDLVASGWSGWASNDPEGPYWGKLGQSAEWAETGQGFRNFKLTSVYIGIIPFLLGAFGFASAIRSRKTAEGKIFLFWSIAGLLAFWLAFGKFSLLYKGFYHLPLIGSIRAPMKLMDNFLVCLGIVSAYGLDRLIAEGKARKSAKILWISGAVCAALMLVSGLKIWLFPASRLAEFSKMGFEPYAETMVENMANAWFQGGLLAFVCAGLVFVVWKGLKPSKWVALAFVVVLAGDSLLLTSHYFKATDISQLKKGNVVVNYIKENQGNERTFLLDPGGIYNQWLASDGPYHDLNLFNIWQMSRMPPDYKEFLETVGRNQIRLWELSAVKYVAAPASVLPQFSQNPQLDQLFKPVLNYQVPTVQGMRKDVLLEFNGSIPRFALFSGWESVLLESQCERLASSQHYPHTILLVDPSANLGTQPAGRSFRSLDAQVTKRMATIRVAVETQSIVRFSQHYEAGWTVMVDGSPAELLRVDFICMGVAVPAGEHVVEFRCIDGSRKTMMIAGVFVLSILVAAGLLRSSRKARA